MEQVCISTAREVAREESSIIGLGLGVRLILASLRGGFRLRISRRGLMSSWLVNWWQSLRGCGCEDYGIDRGSRYIAVPASDFTQAKCLR
jgi:hypothetical protein